MTALICLSLSRERMNQRQWRSTLQGGHQPDAHGQNRLVSAKMGRFSL